MFKFKALSTGQATLIMNMPIKNKNYTKIIKLTLDES